MSPLLVRASFIRHLAKAQDALRQLAELIPQAQTEEERIAVLQAINQQALTIIMLVNEVLDAQG